MSTSFEMNSGLSYLENLALYEDLACKDIGQPIQKQDSLYEGLGLALLCLYQIAICCPGCRGGDHVLEALVGRLHNQLTGAFRLLRHGYYDESLSLVRNSSEIVNLLMLFHVDSSEYRAWRNASDKKRIAKYGPAAVRRKFESKNIPIPIGRDEYKKLCEDVVHPTPSTRPNLHSDDILFGGFVGGVYQKDGFDRCYMDLTIMALNGAVICAGLFRRGKFFDQLTKVLDVIIEEHRPEFEAENVPEEQHQFLPNQQFHAARLVPSLRSAAGELRC